MLNLQDFIKVYDNVLPIEMCDKLIGIYNKNQKTKYENPIAKFDQVNVNMVCNDGKFMTELTKIQTDISNRYVRELPPLFQMPMPNGYEQFRIKKYKAGGIFDWHIDVVDYASAKRYLAFLWYLTDNENDGHTTFLAEDGFSVAPKKGSVVIFPPVWLFPHRGDLVKKEKIIMSSYLHY